MYTNLTLKRLVVTALGAGILATGMAYAEPHRSQHGDHPAHHLRMIERFADKLDLNTNQKDKLKNLSDVLEKQRQTMHSETKLQDSLPGLISGNKLDRNKALELAQAHTRAMQEATPLVISAAADFYDSLNPEQQSKVREWMQKRKHKGTRD